MELMKGLSAFEQGAVLTVLGIAIAGIAYAFWLRRQILKEDKGTPRMQEVWGFSKAGANAYLSRQFRTMIIMVFGIAAPDALLGFGFGGSLIALFMRVGGGIYTKAADVGADLVGKVEAGIPEDDPRNAAVIADLVGDNVGDCAGMAADVFESYEVTIVAAMILGYASFGHKGVIFPLLVRAIGVIGSIISTYSVRTGDSGDVKTAMRAVNRGLWFRSILSVGGFMLLGFFYL